MATKIEHKVIHYLTEGVLNALKRFFILLIVFPVMICFVVQDYIFQIPKRYESNAVIKLDIVKLRNFKSSILAEKRDGLMFDPSNPFVGYSKEDLKVMLSSKFITERGKRRSRDDAGPFITSIVFPKDSNLIVIRAEASDKKKGQAEVDKVIRFLSNECKKNRKLIMKNVIARRSVIERDMDVLKKDIRKLYNIERQIGFTPQISEQISKLKQKKTHLEYMIHDINLDIKTHKGEGIKMISSSSSIYPVTTRRLFYFAIAGFLGLIISLGVLFLISIKKYIDAPPPFPGQYEV